MSCAKCNVDLVSDSEGITCSECQSLFHPTCTKLRTIEKFKKMGSKKQLWRCDQCTSETSSVKSLPDSETDANNVLLQAINGVKSDIKNRFDSQEEKISRLEGSMSSLHTKYDGITALLEDLKLENKELKKTCVELSEKTELLKKENFELRNDVRDLQQYSRKTNIEVSGVPVTPRENVYGILESLARVLGVPWSRGDFSIAHRVPSKGNPLIVARFISISTRDAWLAAKKSKGEINARDLNSNLQPATIFVNEHLSPHNKHLMSEARKMKRAQKIAFVWCKNGRVMVRRDEGSKSVWVRELEDLHEVTRH